MHILDLINHLVQHHVQNTLAQQSPVLAPAVNAAASAKKPLPAKGAKPLGVMPNFTLPSTTAGITGVPSTPVGSSYNPMLGAANFRASPMSVPSQFQKQSPLPLYLNGNQ